MKLNLERLFSIPTYKLLDPHPELNAKKSAVIIPLFKMENKEYVILIKRSSHLPSHPGQLAFPGGVYSEEDKTLEETAFREWEEELGSNRENLKLIAPYKPTHTFTGFLIFPFFAEYIGDFKFQPNPKEVEKVIFLDLEDFNSKPFYAIQSPRHPNYFIYYLDLGEEVLWGATAYLILEFLKELADFQRKPKLVKKNLETPPFLDVKKL